MPPIGTAALNLDYTSITAPVAGKVGLRQADLGNYVTPGDATGIVVITQVQPIDVTFTLPQVQLPEVQAQLRAGRSCRSPPPIKQARACWRKASF